MIRRLFIAVITLAALALCFAPFVHAQTPTARRRIRVEDSPCAPATAWRVRDTNYATLTIADAAAKKPIACPVVTPPPVVVVPPPVVTPPVAAGVWVNVTPTNVDLVNRLSCDNYGVENVQADPTQPGSVYAFFHCQGLWKSIDYGATWTGPLSPASVNDCAGGIRIGGDGAIYLACIRGAAIGFQRSRDHGVTWTHFAIAPAPAGRQDVYPPSVDPYDPLHLVMAGHEQDLLVESFDGGASWSNLAMAAGMKSGAGTGSISFINTGVASSTRTTFLWMAQQTGTIGTWLTRDAASWTKVDGNEHPHGFAEAYQAPNGVLYIAGAYSAKGWGVLRSSDFGATWSHVIGATGNQRVVIGTAKTLFASVSYPSGLGTSFGPDLQTAAQPGTGAWSSMSAPAAMQQGASQAIVISDGTSSYVVTANYGAGLWRYTESGSTAVTPPVTVPPVVSPSVVTPPMSMPPSSALTNGVPLDTGVSIALIRANPVLPRVLGFEGNFRTKCFMGKIATFDPIVYPGQPVAGHPHGFFGNIGLTPSSTPETLRLSGNSTCYGGILNRTGYWVPVLSDSASGEVQIASEVDVYYKSAYLDPHTITVIPAGLRMIAGDKTRTVPEEFISWNCSRTWNQQAAMDGMIPDCAVGEDVILSVGFPECWDGKNLDSPDHRSHMATMVFRNPGPSVCPATHPVPIPKITENFHFPVTANSHPTRWRLSSDMYTTAKKGGLSAHADWMNGWDQAILTQFTQTCINATRDCTVDLGDGRQLFYKD